jgi:DNA-binding Lrp family transcriptional regulator
MIETINQYTVKILMSAEDDDSIRSISKKTNISYGWTYYWIEKLVDLGAIERNGQKIKLNKNSRLYNNFIGFIKDSLKSSLSLSDAYSLPNLTGLDYAFTETDSIFIWTKGGYNIGRNKENYPIFIEVLSKDLGEWHNFFDRFFISYSDGISKKDNIYFILIKKDSIKSDVIDGVSVIPLKDTVEYAKRFIYNFEPALEMLDSMYKLNMKSKYSEKGFNAK